MRYPEREVIERITHNLRGLRDGMLSTNMSRRDRALFEAIIDRMRLELLALLEEAPHDC